LKELQISFFINRREDMKFQKEISGTTALYALIGNPVSHSNSPAMHNRAFAFYGLDARYLAFKVTKENLESALRGMVALGFKGFNVTMPHKREICKYLDTLAENAALIGAVNTVVVSEEGHTVGHNTDASGFISMLADHGVGIRGQTMVQIGAGGAGRAIAIQVALAGLKELVLVNRTLEKALALKELIENKTDTKVRVYALSDEESFVPEIETCDLLVNTSSIGMAETGSKISFLKKVSLPAYVADIIYNPDETELLLEAKKQGAHLIKGIEMLHWQGADAFTLWTGKPYATSSF